MRRGSSDLANDMSEFIQFQRANKELQRDRVRQNRLQLEWEKSHATSAYHSLCSESVLSDHSPSSNKPSFKQISELIISNLNYLSDTDASELIQILSLIEEPDAKELAHISKEKRLRATEEKIRNSQTQLTPYRYSN